MEVPVSSEGPEEFNAQEESQHSTGETRETRETGTTGQEAGERDQQTPQSTEEIPDVTLDVSGLNLDEAHLQVDNLRARISLQAELADMVKINVGVDAFLEKVELDLNGLEAQALLKANLENVRDIIGRTLESLDDNPQLAESLTQPDKDSGGELEGVAGTIRDAYEKPQDETPEAPEDQEDAGEQEPDGEDAGEIKATDAAWSKAEELGMDLAQIEGTGSGGRIIARDVQRAAKQA